MSTAWYWPDWNPLECSDPPEESCADAGCPRHGRDDIWGGDDSLADD